MSQRKEQRVNLSGKLNLKLNIGVKQVSAEQKSLDQSFYLLLNNLEEVPEKYVTKPTESRFYKPPIKTATSQVIVPSSRPEVVSTSQSFAFSSRSKFPTTTDSQCASKTRKDKSAINQNMKQRLESKMNKAFMMLDDLRDNYIKRKVEKESILSSSRQKNEGKRLSFA